MSDFQGYKKTQGFEKATAKQMQLIEKLTRQKKLGKFATHGIKAILGKNPVNGLSKRKASEVIDGLMNR